MCSGFGWKSIDFALAKKDPKTVKLLQDSFAIFLFLSLNLSYDGRYFNFLCRSTLVHKGKGISRIIYKVSKALRNQNKMRPVHLQIHDPKNELALLNCPHSQAYLQLEFFYEGIHLYTPLYRRQVNDHCYLIN
ncbi:hypothetical protein DX926_01315 [Bacillus atrophaeus]|nr:hypothetical protein DX926_01315 [Bacillus atrophaeus]